LSLSEFVTAARKIRNACGHDPAQQHVYVASSLPAQIQQVILRLSGAAPLSDEENLAVLVGLQTLSNLVTGNPTGQHRLLSLWQSNTADSPAPSLAAVMDLSSSRIKETVATLLLNTVARNPAVTADLLLRTDAALAVWRGLLLLTELHQNDTSTLFGLTFAITNEVIDAQITEPVYRRLVDADKQAGETSPLAVGPSAITFLKFIDSRFHQALDHLLNRQKDTADSALFRALADHALDLFSELAGVLLTGATTDGKITPSQTLGRQLLVSLSAAGSSQVPGGLPSVDHYVSYYTTLVLVLQILKHVSQLRGQVGLPENRQKELLRQTLGM
ncbi:hypothetical protein IWQ60_007028, partial [Tieghemiomyces parasiticus]